MQILETTNYFEPFVKIIDIQILESWILSHIGNAPHKLKRCPFIMSVFTFPRHNCILLVHIFHQKSCLAKLSQKKRSYQKWWWRLSFPQATLNLLEKSDHGIALSVHSSSPPVIGPIHLYVPFPYL